MTIASRGRGWSVFAVLAAIAIASRLPQLVASPYLPDGDEALQGVIAHHALHGEGIPLFTWGQRYGLSAVETSVTTVMFGIFGESATALHTAVLLLWCAGMLLFVAAVRRFAGRSSSLWVGACLIACPAWLATSMKAWATSVTAFFFCGLALWAMSCVADPGANTSNEPPVTRRSTHPGMAVLVGVAAALAAAANALWMVFLGPLLAVIAWRRLARRQLALAAAGAGSSGVLIAIAIARAHGYWETPIFSHPTPLSSLHDLPRRVWVTFTGAYFLSRPEPPGPIAAVVAVGWSVATALVLARSTVRASDERGEVLETGLVLSLIAGLALTLVIHPVLFGYRYLLPALTAAALLIGLSCAASGRSGRIAGAALVAVLPMIAMEFRHLSPLGYDPTGRAATVAPMDSLLHYLDGAGIHSVYSIESMLQWNVMFSSGGRVNARWLNANDRDGRFPRAVDCAAERGDRIAVIGRVAQLDSQSVAAVRTFDRMFFVLPDPPPARLASFGFQLNPCGSR
jgi:hypothetical protein